MTRELLAWMVAGIPAVAVGALVLFLSKFAKNLLTPYDLDKGLTKDDNPALGLATAGYFAGVIIIYLGATAGPTPEEIPTFLEAVTALGYDLAWAVGGILALNLSRWILDRLVLTKFSLTKEIIDDRNVGAGAVEAGTLIAGALVIAGAIHGEGTILSGVVFYALGQAALIVFAFAYQAMTKWNLHAELESDNAAAGLAYGLNIMALGILLLNSISAGFESWGYNLTLFAGYAVGGFVVLAVLRLLVDWIMLPGTTIRHEIANDRSVNAAWIEGVTAVGIASLVLFLL